MNESLYHMSWVVDYIEEHIIIKNKLYASLNFPYIFLPTSFNQKWNDIIEMLNKENGSYKIVPSKRKKKKEILCHTLMENANKGRHAYVMHSSKCISWLCKCIVRAYQASGCLNNENIYQTFTMPDNECQLCVLYAVYDRKCIQLCNSEYWCELIDACLRHNFHGLMLRKLFHARNFKRCISIVKHFILIKLLN